MLLCSFFHCFFSVMNNIWLLSLLYAVDGCVCCGFDYLLSGITRLLHWIYVNQNFVTHPVMSFRSIVRDVREGFGSLSRRSFEVRLPGHQRGKSHGSVHDLHDQPLVIQTSRWASLPPELLRDVVTRLEESESVWPARKHVVACAAVCRSWREMCKEIVKSPEFSGKITFPVSLKQVQK